MLELGVYGLAAVVALFVVDRVLLKAEEKGWIYWRRRKGSPRGAGLRRKNC